MRVPPRRRGRSGRATFREKDGRACSKYGRDGAEQRDPLGGAEAGGAGPDIEQESTATPSSRSVPRRSRATSCRVARRRRSVHPVNSAPGRCPGSYPWRIPAGSRRSPRPRSARGLAPTAHARRCPAHHRVTREQEPSRTEGAAGRGWPSSAPARAPDPRGMQIGIRLLRRTTIPRTTNPHARH